MAEWSKAGDSSSLHANGVGSNPTRVTFSIQTEQVQLYIDERFAVYQRRGAEVAQWAHNSKVGGSKPLDATFFTVDVICITQTARCGGSVWACSSVVERPFRIRKA